MVFDFSTIKHIFRENEKHYNLALLFLSINHPDNFPNFISPIEFCTKYDFKKIELDYYISELLESDISKTNIFLLKTANDKSYYFHEKGKLAKILKVLVQDYLERKFEKTMERQWRKFDYDIKIPLNYDELSEIVLLITEKHRLFNDGLKSSLLRFLPSYINYLEYKIEQKYERLSKRKLLISRDFEMIDYLKTSMDLTEVPSEPPKLIEKKTIEIFDKIKYFNKKNLDSIKLSKTKINKLIKNKKFDEALREINKILPLFDKIDSEIQFFEKTSTIDEKYYYMRLFFYNKKIDCLINLNKLEEILGVAIKTYDLQTISEKVIELIELEQYETAYEISEKAIDPYKKLSHEDLLEARNTLNWDTYAHFHNKIIDEFKNNNYENALIIIDKFLNFNPNDQEMVENQIKAYFYLGKYEKALEMVNDAIEKWPKYPKSVPINWELIGTEEAGDIIEDSQKDEIDNIYYGYKFCHLKARILLNMEKYNESLQILEKIIKVNPNISETYFLRSLNESELGNLDQALQSIDFAIKIDSNKDLYYGVKSDFLHKLNRNSDALKMVNKAMELNPKKPIYYNIKAKILLFMNRPNSALDTINHGIKRFPDFSTFYKTKSLILSDDEKSLEALEKAEKLGVNISYYNKAQLLYNLGRNDEALKAMNIHIKKYPEELISHELKAAILAELGRFDEAFKSFDKINEINAEYSNVSSIRHHIYNKMAYYYTEKRKKEEAIEAIKESD